MNEITIPRYKRGRELVWHDEFENSVLDSSKWSMRRTMTCPDAVYVNDSAHIEIKDNMLNLYVHKSESNEKPFSLPEGLTTMERMCFRYGYVEARLRLPFRHGAWPSFWMKTNTEFSKADYMAEIDILEVFSSPKNVVSNLHKWGRGLHVMLPGGEGSSKRAYTFKDYENLNDEFHVYGLEWDQNFMSFYVDDVMYAQYPIDEENDFSKEELPGMQGFHDFAYLIFNNEIFTANSYWKPEGSALTGDEDFPIKYTIDWVRLYQNKESERIVIYD